MNFDFDNDENLDYQLNKIASIVIKEKRLQKGYSLEEVANKLNNIITRQSLYRYENNEARMKNNIFKKICLALNENPSDVWEEINNRFLNHIDFDKSNNRLDNLEWTTINGNNAHFREKGGWRYDNWKRNVSNGKKGKPMPESQREFYRQLYKGERNPFYGKHN